MRDMFNGCNNLVDISSIKDWDAKAIMMTGMFYGTQITEYPEWFYDNY